MAGQGGLGLMRRGTERCGLVGQGGLVEARSVWVSSGLGWHGGHGFSRLAEFWRGMARQGG